MQERIPAPKKGPSRQFRFRSQAEIDRIKRAARLEGLTFNTFVVGRAALAAEATLKSLQEQQTA